jgi:hypothetical protein
MRLGLASLAGWLLFILFTPYAVGETIYTYKDLSSGRDVYVNRLEQVPIQYRDQAKPVVWGDPSKALIDRGQGRTASDFGSKGNQASLQAVGQTLKEVWKEKPLSEIRATSMIHKVDQKLKAQGCKKVGPEKVASFTRMFFLFVVLILITSVASLVAWIVLMFHAYRLRRPWWMILMVLISPLVFIYAVFKVDEARVKYLTLLGLLSPILVGVLAAWQSMAWLRPVLETCAKTGS